MNELCEAVTTTITPNGRVTLPFVIPSAAEGSAVLRAIPGNVFDGTLPGGMANESIWIGCCLKEKMAYK